MEMLLSDSLDELHPKTGTLFLTSSCIRDNCKKPSMHLRQVSTPGPWYIIGEYLVKCRQCIKLLQIGQRYLRNDNSYMINVGWDPVFVQRLLLKVLDAFSVTKVFVYYAEPLEGITDVSEQKLVLGGEVCMWGETADASNVQQTIWPRAAAAAERLWSNKESSGNPRSSVLPRLEYFRCLLTRRGVPAAPVRNFYARRPPGGPGSCYEQ
ncbi:UNVERIFIED_CONTAM: Beta-hexosaminidase 1 [Sesamum indicum]